MCGILTVLNLDGREVNPAVVREMTNVLFHRGPDDQGFHTSGNVGLGFRRLSIIDLSGGHQPMANEDGSLWIVFNGEIYNFPPLREELEKRGHAFTTKSDTECILHAYEEWQEECVQKLNGIFAFVIWDQTNRRLFAARDHLGIKPLHYYFDGKRLILCSELKCLLKHPGLDLSVDANAIDQFFTYGVIPAPLTIYTKARKLPPANSLTFHNNHLSVRRYWQISPENQTALSEEDCLEALDELLTDSVRIQLISDVPLGAFLSGGIDSSMIVAVMSKLSSDAVQTFSVGFENEKFDERKYARIVATKFNTQHTEYVARTNIAEDTPRIIANFDEPYFDSSAIPTYYVSRMARQNVTVCLSGDGGDELFAGYNHYPVALRKERVARAMPPWLRSALRSFSLSLPFGFKGKNRLHACTLVGPELYVQGTRGQSFDLVKEVLYSCSLMDVIDLEARYAALHKLFEQYQRRGPLSTMLLSDLQTYLPDDILTKVDRTSMLSSLEVRVPFLDYRLVEFVSSIPPQMKYNGRVRKYLLRKLADRYLPPEIVNRSKRGFVVPLRSWLTRDLRETALDLLNSRRFRERGLFNRKVVDRFLKSTFGGNGRYYSMVWLLFCLELWFAETEKKLGDNRPRLCP